MATTQATLIQQTRRYLRDWSDFDATSGSLTASATTVTVADSTVYALRWPIEIDQETMLVTSLASSTTLTVRRGMFGSTAVSHAASASVLIKPAYYSVEIIDAINEGMQASFPYIYRPVVDTSLTVLTNQYQYVIPTMPGFTSYPIPRIYNIDMLQPGDYTFRKVRRWELHRGFVTAGSPSAAGSVASTFPVFQFKSLPPVGSTIRVSGYGPFAPLVASTDTLDTLWPPDATYLLPIYAAASLLMSAEAGRSRITGPRDDREAAYRSGGAMQAGAQLMQRFRQELLGSQMPPMPKHIKAVI